MSEITNNSNDSQSMECALAFIESVSDESDINKSKKRFVNELLTLNIDTNVSGFDPIHNFFADPDAITKDMFVIGEINLPYLIINIPNIIHMDLNLTVILRKSIAQRKMKFINLLCDMEIDIFQLEPIIMPATASLFRTVSESESDFVSDLLNKFIDMKIPIYQNNYACVYILAAVGKVDILEKIMKTYTFNNMTEIIGKICAVAVQTDQVKILEFYMPVKTFDTIPDIIFQYFLKGIEYGDNINVIKYLTTGCIQISQENYLAVTKARQFKRRQILKYFIESDPKVIELLNLSEINEYGLNK